MASADRSIRRAVRSIALCCALSACNPAAFDQLTQGETREDGGLNAAADASAMDAGLGDASADASDPEAGRTVLPSVCEGEATICEGSRAQRTCEDGQWSEPEACEFKCIGAACGGRCGPGERRCQMTQRQRCDDDGEWIDDGEPCDSVCNDGVCEGACTPQDTQCVSSTRVQTCNADGLWDEISACPFACVGSACGGECVPGAQECVPETPRRSFITCSTEGAWSEPSMCSYVCTASGECGGQCVPGSRSCMSNTPHACSGEGVWAAEAACGGNSPVCVGEGNCRCRPGMVRCGGDGTQPQVCNASNHWVNVGAACGNCSNGRCDGEGCSDQRIFECGQFGAACVNNECNGGFGDVGDGCEGARRSACAGMDCGCVDGLCSGGFCDGSGCTGRVAYNCEQFGCGCSLQSCAGGACP